MMTRLILDNCQFIYKCRKYLFCDIPINYDKVTGDIIPYMKMIEKYRRTIVKLRIK